MDPHPRRRRPRAAGFRQGGCDRQHAVGRGVGRAQRRALGARPRSSQRPRHRVGQGQRLHRRRRRRRIPCRARRSGRDRDRQAWLGHVRAAGRGALSDGRADPRLLPGRRPRAGTRVPVSHRRRRSRHASRIAGSDAGHRARVGRHPPSAAIDRRARGVRPVAHRPDHRRAQGETPRDRRRMRAGADHGECGARRAVGKAGAALAALPAVADPQSTGAPDHRGAGAQGGGAARAPRALSGAVRHSRAVGEVRRQRARRTGVRPGVDSGAARGADGGQSDPRVRAAGALEVARQGRRFQGRARARRRCRDDGRRHRGMVRVARADRHLAGPERGADRAGDGPGFEAVRGAAEGSAPRARRRRPPDPRRRRRGHRPCRRHHRGDLREPGREARAVRRGRGEGQAVRGARDQYFEHPARGYRGGHAGRQPPRRPALFQSGGRR